jgi:hypothetical protein
MHPSNMDERLETQKEKFKIKGKFRRKCKSRTEKSLMIPGMFSPKMPK